jgi:hypothetical protein
LGKVISAFANFSVNNHRDTARLLYQPLGICDAALFAQESRVTNVIAEFFRCAPELIAMCSPAECDSQPGYFRFGPGTICYGPSAIGSLSTVNSNGLPDLARYVTCDGSTLRLPFDASTIVDNLRLERYPANVNAGASAVLSSETARRVYYQVRPMLSDSLRKNLQKLFLLGWNKLPFPQWPVDASVEHMLERLLLLSMKAEKLDRVPFIWFWPDGASSSAIMTHDVETNAGINFVPDLIDIDDAFGIKASYQLIPERRYRLSRDLLDTIRKRGCEINVHGLNHDGNLFRDRKTFLKQAHWINHYVQDYGADGFRSACMYRNVAWYDELGVSYDMSVPNVAHLEPQRGGCCTVFPYFIGRILELPLTTVQDYSLFHILGDYSIELWKKQIELILERHGLISFIVHPDYLLAEKALLVYKNLLAHLSQLRSTKRIWIARPGDVNRWWRQRNAMKLVFARGKWCIIGPGQERARIAFASIKDDKIVYSVEQSSEVLATSSGL